MECKTHTTTIQGHEYAYTQLPATKSLKLKYRLMAIFGNALIELIPALGKPDEEQILCMGKAIEDIFISNDPDTIVVLLKDAFIPVFRDGARLDFDEAFTDNLGEMYELFLWVVRTEYGNFFKGMERLLPPLKKVAKQSV